MDGQEATTERCLRGGVGKLRRGKHRDGSDGPSRVIRARSRVRRVLLFSCYTDNGLAAHLHRNSKAIWWQNRLFGCGLPPLVFHAALPIRPVSGKRGHPGSWSPRAIELMVTPAPGPGIGIRSEDFRDNAFEAHTLCEGGLPSHTTPYHFPPGWILIGACNMITRHPLVYSRI